MAAMVEILILRAIGCLLSIFFLKKANETQGNNLKRGFYFPFLTRYAQIKEH